MKIRINTDVTFIWKLLMEGEAVDWSSYDLTLEIMTPSHSKETIHFTSNGTELTFKYKPNQIGQYFLSAFINRFKEDEQALDVKLFEGVRWSFLQENEDEDLIVETINLSGNIREGHIDLRRYYTKDEIDFNFYTKDEIEAKKFLTGIPNEYITETELAYKNYSTKTELYVINDKFNQYYNKTDIENKNYVTQSYLNNKGYLSSIPSNYVTDSQMQSAINSSQNNIQNTLLNYYNKEQVDSLLENIPQNVIDLSDYYTKYEVEALIDSVNSKDIDLTGYYTKSEIDDLLDDFSGSSGDQPDLSDYYTKTDIDNKNYITQSQLDNKGYITSIPDEYVTSTELETRIGQIDIPETDLSGKVDGDGVSKLKVISETDYNNLTQKEPNTLYILL